MEKVKFGILGTAGIASKNVRAMKKSQWATPYAIASRSIEKAEEWARKHSVPKAYGSYEELLQDPEVQAVYLPLPTFLRFEWAKKAAEKKKHVLVEKPVGVTYQQAEELVRLCQANGVMFMDGVMWSHHIRTTKIHKQLYEENALGPINKVVSSFTIRGDEEFFKANIRVKGSAEPLGCLGDLGWYCIRGILWAYNWELPHRVHGLVLRQNEDQVPLQFVGTLVYEGNRNAHFDCAFDTVWRQTLEICSPDGRLLINDFIINDKEESSEWFLETGHHLGALDVGFFRNTTKYQSTERCCQEAEMFNDFGGLVASGHNGPWPEITLKTQKVLNALFDSARSGGWVSLQ